ncbi:MqnA/MqnD/SBP family protein [Chloracidobacterium aggregatum]|uniref:MqnA/MqnD/SBP family protein n=1 Tax=Chloracidobacterium aggregatum TaxID=2851959 RepID=UPI0024B5C166|nr:MqnA/MqnD/SBP family protein [Chloracidobacterium aggregatum]
MPTLTLGYSPCPNDTYIFGALALGIVRVPGLAFDIRLADVQTLNEWALEGRLDVTKLSFAAWLTPEVSAPYALLEVGAALGRNCGPLVVAREPMELGTLRNKQVVTPGRLTTAHLLLRLFTGDAPIAAELPFERIMPAVAGGFTMPASSFTKAALSIQTLGWSAWWIWANGGNVRPGCPCRWGALPPGRLWMTPRRRL